MAGVEQVQLGGGHGRRPPEQGVHRGPGQPPPPPARRPLHPGHPLLQAGDLPQGRRHQPVPPRQLQGRVRGGQAGQGIAAVPHRLGREQRAQPLPQEAGGFPAVPRPGGIAHVQPQGRAAAGLVGDGHLPAELVLLPGGQLHLHGGQHVPVLVGKQAGGEGAVRDGAAVRPQEEQDLHLLVGHPGGVPRRHRVQGHGDGPHVILGQRQGKQPGELVQLHRPVLQQQGALLQPPHQNVPELAVLGGGVPVPPPVQAVRPLGQPGGQINVL